MRQFEMRRDPGTSARGHVTLAPTRSLRARGAVAPDNGFRMAEVGGVRLQ
jgi:hypothetical protein